MKLKSLTLEEFQQYLLDNQNVVVKFSATWCAPCQASIPMFEQAADEYPNVSFVEVDVEKQPRLAAQFNIRSIPTTIGWKDARLMWQAIGTPTSQSLRKEISKLIA